MRATALLILGLGIAGLFYLLNQENASSSPKIESQRSEAPQPPTINSPKSPLYLPPRFIQSEAIIRNDLTKLPKEAELLKDLTLPERSAIQHIHVLLHSLKGSANQGYYPTGDNIEVTNALLGENYRKIAYLPQGHPRINSLGELTDRWGTPYHFHFLSSTHLTIRSAGPDQKIQTDDDLLQELGD